MKKICGILLSLILVISDISVFADRNEERRKKEEAELAAKQEQNTVVSDSLPNLPDKLLGQLADTVVIKTGSDVFFENGKGKKTDVKAFFENDTFFVPAAVICESFGQKAIWIEETKSVKIGDIMVHPSDTSTIVDGRTMIKAESLAEYLGVSVLYNNNETVIFGKNTIAQETIDEVVSRLRNTFYVVNDTTVKGDGSLENPFGGFKAAVEGIRAFTQGGMMQDITVYLRGGLYTTREEITFMPEDSGKNDHYITYKSYPGEVAEISGSETITGWTKYTDEIFMAPVTPPGDINMLFENDSFARKARYPNLGDQPFRDYYLRCTGYNTANTKQFYFASGDIPYIKDTTGMQIVCYGGGPEGIWNWDMNIYNASIDYRSNTVTMGRAPTYVMGKGSRYYVQGCLELLDQDGEFWYDATNRMMYYNPFNNDINSQTITYATIKAPIAVRGTEKNRVKNLIFEDLKISKGTIDTVLWEGMHEGNIFQYADNCAIRNSEILQIGGDAVHLQYCNNCEVSGNYIHDVASNGVRIYSSNYDGEIRYSGNIVTNNYINNIGLVKRDSNAIWLFHADKNTITHNKIINVTRNGISIYTGNIAKSKIGRTIRGKLVTAENQFDYCNSIGNYVAYNDISVCMEDSQDGGPFYTWGAGKNNVIENNHIHDSEIHFSIGYGMYGDDATAYTTYRNNIIDNLQKEGNGKLNAVMITKSLRQTVTNNFFLENPAAYKGAFSTETKLNDEHNEIVYTKNITMNSSDQLHGQWTWYDDRFRVCDYNYYFNDSGNYLMYNNSKAKDYEEWKQIQGEFGMLDQNSIAGENPNFVDYENRDFRLRYDSKAFDVGIEDIDEKNIGLTADFKFADKEEELHKLYLETDTDGLSANIRLASGKTSKILTSARTVSGFFANLDNAQISYSSSDENVAVVKDGVITAKNTGVAEIKVTAVKNGKTVSSVLFVLVNDNFNKLEVKAVSDILDIGTTTELICVPKSSMGYTIPGAEYSYTTSNPAIATVDENGLVTAVGQGEVIISVVGSYKGVTQRNTVKVRVLNGVLDTVTVKMDKVDAIVPGEQVQVKFDAKLTTGAEFDYSTVNATYEVAKENVATIDENGLLTAVSPGRTKINVKLEKDGFRKEGSIKIAVFDKYEGTLADGYKEVNFGTSHGYADFTDDKIMIRATGNDFFGKADDGYYLYKEIDSNFPSIELNVESLFKTDADAAVGVTLRESATPESKNVTLRMKPDKGLLMVWRAEDGGDCGYFSFGNSELPVKIKLEKVGNTVSGYVYRNDEWQLIHSVDVVLSRNITAGIPVFAQSPDDLSTETVVSGLVINE